VVQRAQAAGVDIIGDMDLWHRLKPECRTIGITGTNGKSTTTALVHHVLSACGRESVAGGNLGIPVMDLPLPGKDGFAVLEISSYQMDLCPTFRPDISALLNVTPDHEIRHGDMAGYAASKARIMEGGGAAAICIDDDFTRVIFDGVMAAGDRRAVSVSVSGPLRGGVSLQAGVLVDDIDGSAFRIGSVERFPTLRGLHNWQNALCAYAVCRLAGLQGAEIFAAMENFPGLQHRQFLVRTINGVGYINDSKATNPAASAVALASHAHIYWIVGGRKKEAGLSGLEGYADRIMHGFLIGEAEGEFSEWFERRGIPYTRSHTLDRAVTAAHDMAQEQRGRPGGAGVVLLSPACASFDQYRSFEERGDHFCRIVKALNAEVRV
jgi:UDP-N-acetylmuramoylalanine--D-glutamate ligase